MPFDAYQTQGPLPVYDLKEFTETGLLVTDVSLTPRVNIKEKVGHLAASLGQIVQVQTWRQALDIEIKGEIIPDVNGKATGLGNVYPGQAVTVANFSSAVFTGDDTAHGFTRDDTKLLMVKEVKRELNNEKPPAVTVPMSYYPAIAV